MSDEKSNELFYIDKDGNRQDAKLHDEMLRGSHLQAVEIGYRTAVGLTDAESEALFGHHAKQGILPARRNAILAKHRERYLKKPIATDAGFNEADHPRGQPENKGEFAPAGGGGGGGKKKGGHAEAFVSPSVATHLSFEQAKQGLKGKRQAALHDAGEEIDHGLGISTKQSAVIGAWADGAENSTMLTPNGDVPFEVFRAAAAMRGHLADQKAVLVFKPDEAGHSFVAQFAATGALDEIHADLLKKGISFHTLEPVSGGAVVHVYGGDQETIDKVTEAAKGYGREPEFTAGEGEFLGTSLGDDKGDREQRDDARRQYEKVISELPVSEGRNGQQVWQAVRDHWGGSLPSESAEVTGGEKPDIHKSMAFEAADSRQPVKSLDELYDRAKAEEPAFRTMVEKIAGATGSVPKFHEANGSILKDRASSERKLKDELAGDFTRERDVLRGTVVSATVENTRNTAAEFIQQQGANILRVKDRITGPDSSGYRDILINFRTPGGIVAELQFNSKAMIEAKHNGGHALYDDIRTGKAKGSFDELRAKAKALYDSAYQADGNGHWEMTA